VVKLTESGIVVIVADGNKGLGGIWKTGAVSLGFNSLAVASVENSHFLGFKAYDVNDDSFSIEYLTVTARAFPFDKGEIVMLPTNSCPEDYTIYYDKILYMDLSPDKILKKNCSSVCDFLFYLFIYLCK
jgi:hypothetical protein